MWGIFKLGGPWVFVKLVKLSSAWKGLRNTGLINNSNAAFSNKSLSKSLPYKEITYFSLPKTPAGKTKFYPTDHIFFHTLSWINVAKCFVVLWNSTINNSWFLEVLIEKNNMQSVNISCYKFHNFCSSLHLDLISVLTNVDPLKFLDFFKNWQLEAIWI